MHAIQSIRDDPGAFDEGLKARFIDPTAQALLKTDQERRQAQTQRDLLLSERKKRSEEIGLRRRAGEDSSESENKVTKLKAQISELEATQVRLAAELSQYLARLPNLPAPDVPVGLDETANVECRRFGSIIAKGFAPREHSEIGESLKSMDFEQAGKVAGARFVYLKGVLAKLERALGAWMVDLHTKNHGFEEISPPLLVRGEALFGSGQLPKLADESFKTTDDRWLIPTAEVPLANLGYDRIFSVDELPLRFVALTPCFRSEAGAAGRDTHGILRQHQFWKAELVSICRPEDSAQEHEHITNSAEQVLRSLELPFRVMLLSSGDMGFSAHKTYDLEVWLPGQQTYREISSCSNCGSFQARRMNARLRVAGQKGTTFVHTLNGSGVAVGRALIAVLEHGQQEDGSICLPEVLKPYLDGATRIIPPSGEPGSRAQFA